MTDPAKNLLRFLCTCAAVLAGAGALNFLVDPLQLLRPARGFVPMYSSDTRLQNAGLIRSQPFNAVFMGTSLAIHFRQSDIDRVLGVRSLKLAMTGTNSHEQSFVLAVALEQRPQRVVWEIDDWIFTDAVEIDRDIYLPADLYRRNAKGIASYLLSGAMARESALAVARSVPVLDRVLAALPTELVSSFLIANVDDINAFRPDVEAPYNAARAKAAFAHITDPARRAGLSEGYDYKAMVGNFERDVVGLIAGHPDILFDIYFPPYSILQWVAMRDASPMALQIVTDLTAHIGRRLVEFPNVRLHDFRAVKDVTHDLGNYADVIHHSPAIDLKVLSWLASGQYLVDRTAPTASLEQLKAQVEAYRLEP
jgi:hypothetical protein